MLELGFDISKAVQWFVRDGGASVTRFNISAAHAAALPAEVRDAVRRCYITDQLLTARAKATGSTPDEVLDSRLPDPGSTMAGDFGEILAYFFHASQNHPAIAFGPKKWRLKQDRTKPAPCSDVVCFILPKWPTSSDSDVLICTEVKTKSTDGNSTPISAAITGSILDRTSRLSRTLVWLKERAIGEDLGIVTLAHLKRFIDATEHPSSEKRFYAVAVLCESVASAELLATPTIPAECRLVVIVVPKLKEVYMAVFDAVAPPNAAESLASEVTAI